MKAINWILAALAAAALAFCGWSWYQYTAFPADSYAMQVQELDSRTEEIKTSTQELEKELAEREAAVRANLAQAGADGAQAAKRLEAAQKARDEKQAELDELREEAFFLQNIHENTMALRDEYAKKIRQLEDLIVAGESDAKICYWTLDDGPTYQTQMFLDVAAKYDAFLTFFTSREANLNSRQNDANIEMEKDLLRKEAMAGHSSQNHTNSHQYGEYGNLYGRDLASFREQVEIQEKWITEVTGFRPDIFRFPGGSAWAFARIPKEETVAMLKEMGYYWVDWSCNTYDAGPQEQWPDAYSEANYSVTQITSMPIAMILSHDCYLHTLGAIERAIPILQEKGYLFLPLFSESWTMENTTIIYT